MSLENQRLVNVWVESGPWGTLGDLGVWDSRTGGNAGSENTSYAPGGMLPEVQLGGRQTTEDVTVARLLVRERDRPLAKALFAARGQARVRIGDTLLDRSKNPFGAPITWKGVVQEVQWPDADSTSNDPARITLVCSAEGDIAA